MKTKLLLYIFVLLLPCIAHAQTFTGTGGAIPDSGSVQGNYFLTVSGVGNINNNTLGLTSVCVNIIHSWDSDLEIYLVAPDGTSIALSIQNGGSGDDYNSTCFLATATAPIADAIAPFNGAFIPDGYMGAVNNGQNADGVWRLNIRDVSAGQVGTLVNWSIQFSSNLPAAPPACNGNLPPGNTCAEAPPICSFYGYCAATSLSFTADSWPEMNSLFCGTVQNNAFVKFVAAGTYMNFSVWVTTSINHDGIQMQFYDGGCGSGAVTDYGCYSPIRPGSSPNIITASGLTPGNTYYLMIDGYAGDECDYIIEPFPPTGGLSVTAESSSVCAGKSVQLTATGGNMIYSWWGPGLNTYSGSVVTASPVVNSTYSVSSIDPGGICPVTKQVGIIVLNLPAAPTATDSLSYCQEAIALPLIATGTNLLWYYTATGGTGSLQPIIPSTVSAGNYNYYVSQANVCESPRTPINVFIKPKPFLGADKQKTICYGTAADLTREFDGNDAGIKWIFNSGEIAPPRAVNTPGVYTIEISNVEGCADTALIQLRVQPAVLAFAGNDTIAVRGLPHQLHCTAAASYSWSPDYLLNDATLQAPRAVIIHDQEFIVNVTDQAGCTGSDSITVKIIDGLTYYIPNAFTPNGDGLNDVFRAIPVGIAHTDYFRIINRFGKTLFDSNDPFSKGWDGTYLGYKQSPGTYVWFIKGKDIHGKVVGMKGTVVLIR